MRKLTVNHTPTLPTRGNKTAPLRTRIAALLTLSAALLAATTLGGATPASAENAPPPPAPAPAAITPGEAPPAPAENAPPPAPAPQLITVRYWNRGVFNAGFCLHNVKPVDNGSTDRCGSVKMLGDTVSFPEVEFEDGNKVKVETCAKWGVCKSLEVQIDSDTKSLCFQGQGVSFEFSLSQLSCR